MDKTTTSIIDHVNIHKNTGTTNTITSRKVRKTKPIIFYRIIS